LSSTVGESLRAATCFHCGLPAAAGGRWRGSVLGQVREFCCAGCQAVAQAISAGGLEDYYRLRTASAPTAPARRDNARTPYRVNQPPTAAKFCPPRCVGAVLHNAVERAEPAVPVAQAGGEAEHRQDVRRDALQQAGGEPRGQLVEIT